MTNGIFVFPLYYVIHHSSRKLQCRVRCLRTVDVSPQLFFFLFFFWPRRQEKAIASWLDTCRSFVSVSLCVPLLIIQQSATTTATVMSLSHPIPSAGQGKGVNNRWSVCWLYSVTHKPSLYTIWNWIAIDCHKALCGRFKMFPFSPLSQFCVLFFLFMRYKGIDFQPRTSGVAFLTNQRRAVIDVYKTNIISPIASPVSPGRSFLVVAT